MARDDFYVIVYQILAYLYVKLKEGERPDAKMLEPDSNYLKINKQYWADIMGILLDEGYIKGISITKPWGGQHIVENLDDCRITIKGIEYLCDNKFLNKAKQFLKDTKAIVPFI